MDGMLSQEEINALLNSISSDDVDAEAVEAAEAGENTTSDDQEFVDSLTTEEKDAIGEISNISLGTSATTLSQLVNRKVLITTPTVEQTTWKGIKDKFDKPCVYIQISYIEGLDGNNILILRERDVMIIADLMMGGDGTNVEGELTELHLSAISEAMNQMMGSASTSLSSMIERTVDISPPTAQKVTLDDDLDSMFPMFEEPFVRVAFKMEIENLVDSEIMQIYSTDFAQDLYRKFTHNEIGASTAPVQEQQPEPTPVPEMNTMNQQPMMDQQMMGNPMMGAPMMNMQQQMPQQMAPEVNVAPAQFQPFSAGINPMGQQENIDLIMDVPLEVTVELGRTNKSIKEILDFAPGTIIELNKLAGEPIDVLVNGKRVAKGEVVVIEESFGIRVTEILK
ncbi:MAG: flagellar motor switch phosphatase FliY [bacterium]|nr:flagellar motor switch phosphatase FliY [bacterium]